MPHPKNRLKLTGDTHLPDVGDLLAQSEADDLDPDMAGGEAEPRVYADGWTPSSRQALPEESQGLAEPLLAAERKVERRVASTPWLAMGAALAFGFVVAKMLRR